MAMQPVNIGAVANDGTGDTLRDAFEKLNANDAELYQAVVNSGVTATQVRDLLITVDGAGSGIDADLLDGLNSSAFALASHTHTISQVTGLQAALDAKLASSSYTAADVLAKIKTVDGAGSGLDADLLDGLSSAAFATAVHSHAQSDITGLVAALAAKLDASSYTAADVLAKLLTVDGSASGLDADTLDGMNSSAFAAAAHTHPQSDVTGLTAALAAKLDASSYTAADVLAKLLTVDGSSSGLDADLLDGLSSADFAAASHSHAIADVTGLQDALDAKGDLSSEASVSVDSELMLYSGTTGKLAKRASGTGLATLAAGVLSLTDPASFAAAAHTHAQADVTGLTSALAAKLDASAYTAADVLAKLITVDGSGSGLDADLLDGLSSADFAAAAHTHAQSDVTGLTAALAAKLDASSYTAADVLAKLLTVDGAASGLDADLLDGISSAGFLQVSTYEALTPTWSGAHVFSVTPTVPNSSWTYAKIQNVSATSRVLGRVSAGAGVIEELTGAQVATLITYTAADVLSKLTGVDGTGSGLDADLLDGLDSTAFARRTIAQTISANWDFTARQYFGCTAANVALITNLVDGGTPLITNQEVRCHRVGAEPFWVSVRLNGSYAAPTAILTGQILGEFNWGGFDGSAIQTQAVRMYVVSTEDWNTTATGAELFIATATTGTTTKTSRVRIGGNATGGYALFPSGTAAQPGFGFASDLDNGFYLSATNEFSATTGGAQRFSLNSTALTTTVPVRVPDGTVGAPSLAFSTSTTSGFYLSAANEITLGTANVRRITVDSGGRTLFGGLTASTQVGGLANLTVQIGATGSVGMSITRFSADTTAPVFAMGKSRGALGAFNAISSGDGLARWQFCGADGTNLNTVAAGVYATCAGTVSTGVVPGQLEFYTATTAGVFQEAMRITAGGTVLYRDGAVGTPSISLLNDTDTGFYSIAANQLGASCGGTLVLDMSTSVVAITATTLRFNTTTASTVGAAGGASALPATPLGYLSVNVGGTAVKIPYFNP